MTNRESVIGVYPSEAFGVDVKGSEMGLHRGQTITFAQDNDRAMRSVFRPPEEGDGEMCLELKSPRLKTKRKYLITNSLPDYRQIDQARPRLRTPGQIGQRFRSISDTDSNPNRTPNPAQIGQ